MLCGSRDPLADFEQSYPGIWDVVDTARQMRRPDEPWWPEYVYLPVCRAGGLLSHFYEEEPKRDFTTLLGPAIVLTGLAAWRVSQGIYCYDPALYTQLIETPVIGNIPGELLRRLPDWCVYLEMPGMTGPRLLIRGRETPVLGVWAWLDRAATEDILVLMLHVEGIERLPVGMVQLGGTLDESLTRSEIDWRNAVARGVPAERFTPPAADLVPLLASGPPGGYTSNARSVFAPILSLLLYLCGDKRDMARQFPPSSERAELDDSPRIWKVSERLGADSSTKLL